MELKYINDVVNYGKMKRDLLFLDSWFGWLARWGGPLTEITKTDGTTG